MEFNKRFCREIDQFIRDALGNQSLDVSADRIARTAHSAPKLLGDLRERLRAPIFLAWSSCIRGLCAIEVYPAAILKTHGIGFRSYKAQQSEKERTDLSNKLKDKAELSSLGGKDADSDSSVMPRTLQI